MCKLTMRSVTLAMLAYQISGAQVKMKVFPATARVVIKTAYPPTVSVKWDQVAQEVVVQTTTGPTKSADTYGALHTAIYDAWACFDPVANPTAFGRNIPLEPEEITTENQLAAMGIAASEVLLAYFPDQGDMVQAALEETGLADAEGPALRIGKRAAKKIVAKFLKASPTDDNESPWSESGITNAVERWRPEHKPIDDPDGPLQQYLTPFFGRNRTFGIDNGAVPRPPPPIRFLNKELTAEGAEVDVERKVIIRADGTKIAIDKSLIGNEINRAFIRQTRAVIKASRDLKDRTKLFAELWEGAGGTSTPSGLWMTIGQYVSVRDEHDEEEDAKMFLALANGVRDSGIATWNAKLFYFYARPVRVIRDLGDLGLIGNFNDDYGTHVIRAYNTSLRSKDLIPANLWNPYQRPNTEPSPPFPEYTSGHSGFSASAAEVLKLWTGSDFFGGFVVYKKGSSRFEPDTTPSKRVKLKWDTFTDAGDEAATSRLTGGIHFPDGNNFGKDIGRIAGNAAYQKALLFFNGTLENVK